MTSSVGRVWSAVFFFFLPYQAGVNNDVSVCGRVSVVWESVWGVWCWMCGKSGVRCVGGVWCWMCGKSGVNLLLRREDMAPHGEETHPGPLSLPVSFLT